MREYERLLRQSGYDRGEIAFLIEGFTSGFDMGYRGPTKRQDTSDNLPFSVGNREILWQKVMTEVEQMRFAGPFTAIPFEHYVQSPIGLVPKSNGQTRLIFHLSFDFKQSGNKSVNHYIPMEWCTVKYPDLDHAIQICLELLKKFPNSDLWLGVSDLKSAFRVIPARRKFWKFHILKAVDPVSRRTYCFFDKNLGFGSRISCTLFQRFSNSIAHIFEYFINFSNGLHKWRITNYLDNYCFINITEESCNLMVSRFIELCQQMNLPVAWEKMKWAAQTVQFLGIIIDGHCKLLVVPQDKRLKAVSMIKYLLEKKKATVKQIQSLAGLLNFINKAIHLGRAFTR